MANKDSTIPNYVREASYLLCYGVTSRTCDNMIAQKSKFKDLSSSTSLYDLPFQRKHGSYLLQWSLSKWIGFGGKVHVFIIGGYTLYEVPKYYVINLF